MSVGRRWRTARPSRTRPRITRLRKKQTGGPSQLKRVTLRIVPLARGKGVRFTNEGVGGAIPREYVPMVEAGARHAAEAGVVAAFQLVEL